jgi:ubiquinone/menaquinone biosynthesis C-methylase UbiE
MYKELAKYYDLIYDWKDYKKEVFRIKELIKKYKQSTGNQLLDVGCGTGKHLEYFNDDYSCLGVDLNEDMVNVAKENVKDAAFKQADMVNLNLNKTFDVITCLFSSIGYVKTYSNLEKTIRNFANHINQGGVVIIEPWFTKSTFWIGIPGMTTYDGENIKIARVNTTKVEGDLSIMDMHYLIAEKDKDVKYFVDTHELGLFESEKFIELMEQTGFKAEYLEDGLMKDRGLYIGVKS